MAWPWIFEANNETGTNSEWSSESDTGARLDFPHYSELARFPFQAAPFRGAYCMRVSMGDTNNHHVTSTSIAASAGATTWFRWMLFVGSDVRATVNEGWNIFEIRSGATTESVVALRINDQATQAVEIGIGTLGFTNAAPAPLERDRWYQIEVRAVIDSGVGNDGTFTLYVDGAQAASRTGEDQGAIDSAILGTIGTLSTTTGTLLFDAFVQDDTRVYPITDRFAPTVTMTKSAHLFVGPGRIENLALLPGAATDNIVTVYDTDRANTNDHRKIKAVLRNVANSELTDLAAGPITVTRGAYVTLEGTNPRAVASGIGGIAYSAAGMRRYGQMARPNPREVL